MIPKLEAGPFVELLGGLLINPMEQVQSIDEDGLEHSVGTYYIVVEAAVRAAKSKRQ